MLETLDHTIRIGSTPIFLYFDLYNNHYLQLITCGYCLGVPKFFESPEGVKWEQGFAHFQCWEFECLSSLGIGCHWNCLNALGLFGTRGFEDILLMRMGFCNILRWENGIWIDPLQDRSLLCDFYSLSIFHLERE